MLGQEAVVILSLSAGLNLGVTFFSQIKYQFIDSQISTFNAFANDFRKKLSVLEKLDPNYHDIHKSKIDKTFNIYHDTIDDLVSYKDGRDSFILICNIATLGGGIVAFSMFLYAALFQTSNMPTWFSNIAPFTNVPWLMVMLWNVFDYHILTKRCRVRKDNFWDQIQEFPGVFRGENSVPAGP